jgi:plastocyanin
LLRLPNTGLPRALLLAAAAVAAAAVVAGCAEGRANQPDLVNGKELFIGEGTCGSCHALRRAGTQGTQGPDLDAAFVAAREVGQNDETIEGIVHRQIGYPRRGSIMKPHLVTGQDAVDVAAYVGFVAGKPGEDTGALATAGAAQQSDEPAVAEGGVLDIPADPSGALAYTFSEAEAEAGQIEINSVNDSSVDHNIAVEGAGVSEEGEVVNSGGVSTVSADLQPGEYTFLCTVPGHAEGGMEGILTVK